MSTRVQKGGPVFRPVAKPRARLPSEARQTPHSGESRASATPSVGNASAAAASMPPPASIPGPHTSLEPPVVPSDGNTAHPEDASAGASSSNFFIPMPSRNTTRPPMVQATQATTSAVPITIPSRSAPAPIPHAPSQQSHPDARAAAGNSTNTPVPYFGGPSIPPDNIGSTQTAVSTITDAQIDPALLEAVVTALQHANHSQVPSADHVSSAGPSVALSHDSQIKPPRRRNSEKSSRGDIAVDDTADVPSQPKAKRVRRRSSTGTGDVQTGEEASAERPRKRKARAPSLPPYDPDADPGEELDPTAITMAQLCDDMGRGRVSSKAAQIETNHAAWRATNREKRARQRAIMEAKKFGRDLEEEENAANGQPSAGGEEQPAAQASTATPSIDPTTTDHEDSEEQRGDDYDYTQSMATSRYNVQVRIGPNGETIIDETSLFVDRQEEDETVNYTHIEESDTSKFVNSSTYSKKLRGSRWSAEETELFYDALSQFGENYELISYVLPGRDRKACKNKFKAEDRRNPSRITYCLKNRRPVDLETLSRMTGKDFSGPTPIIRAPTPLHLPDEESSAQDVVAEERQTRMKVRKKSRTPAADGVEIIGAVEDEMELANE